MLTSLVLSVTLAAPVPAAPPPVAAGPAPRILELKANADGKVMVAVTRMEKLQVGAGNAINPNGGPAPAVITREVARTKLVELSEVKDLVVTTADGTKIDPADALKKLAAGGNVIVSSDGKPVSPNFLKLFKDDVLVLASPELTGPAGVARPPVAQPLPLPINGGAIQIQPGVVQIQIAPAVLPAVPVAPALPAPVPVPAPK